MEFLTKKDWNIFFNLYNALFIKKYPVSLTHFVTDRCNASCPHCFVQTSCKKELSIEQIEKIASTSGLALRNVSLTGGEPFLREDIFEIANIWYKNSTARSIAICTNGSMPDRIAYFVDNAVKKDLPVSFFFSYDFIEQKHSEYRHIKDLHIKLAESYKIVHKFFPKMNATFNITVCKDNADTAFDTYCYMRDVLKIQNINCTLVRGKMVDKLSDFEKNKIADVYKKIQTSLNKDFDNGSVIGFADKSLTSILLNAKNKILWKYVLKTFVDKKYISPCTAGSLFSVISPDGTVFPCELLPVNFGNLADVDYNLMKCYNSNISNKIRENICKSKCCCTFECTWLLNIFSNPMYYSELVLQVLKNLSRS